MTCALEHFTAMMAEMCLENDDFRELMDPEVRRLLVWHAIEETEHKAVAFDTYVATGGSYSTRVVAMIVTTLGFLVLTALFQWDLMRQDPEAAGIAMRLRGMARLWIYPGWFRHLVPHYLAYFRRDFHPWDRRSPRKIETLMAGFAAAVVRA
jgi:predicted metal-dependent hydrolase